MDPSALPPSVRAAIDQRLHGCDAATLRRASAALSHRYRRGGCDQPHVRTATDVLAYLAARAPATYAATRRVVQELPRRLPDFTPTTLLDVGSGPGTALWAVLEQWPNLERADLVERDPQFLDAARKIAACHPAAPGDINWHAGDLRTAPPPRDVDLVTASYTLGELAPVDLAPRSPACGHAPQPQSSS